MNRSSSEVVEQGDGDGGVVARDVTPLGLDARGNLDLEAVAPDERVVPVEVDVACIGTVEGVALGAGGKAIRLALPMGATSAGDVLRGNLAAPIGPLAVVETDIRAC